MAVFLTFFSTSVKTKIPVVIVFIYKVNLRFLFGNGCIENKVIFVDYL